jgi:PAS domain-containing protein
MPKKPSYEELEQRVKELEKEALERKRVKDALLQEKQRLDDVASSANCGLLLLDEQAKVTYANKLAQQWSCQAGPKIGCTGLCKKAIPLTKNWAGR